MPFPGELQSRQSVECAVKVWTDQGESRWSEPVRWEMGLLDPNDWKASWIEPPEGDDIPPGGKRPGWHLHHAFTTAQAPTHARFYATAQGIYEIHLNGSQVGDIELTPGFTSYDRILQYQTYDVGGLIRSGLNRIDVILSDGWYRGQTGAFRQFDQFGERTAFLAQLEMSFADGSRQLVITDKEWRATIGAVRAADLMQGVIMDFRCSAHALPSSGKRAVEWNAVNVADHDLARLRASPSPPVRQIAEIEPAEIRALDEHRQIIDLGQNIAGWLRLRDLGPAHVRLRLTYGEALDANGDVTTDNIDSTANAEELGLPEAAKMPDEIGPLQVDEVYSAGNASDTFEPRMSTKGFRYVRIEGHPHTLSRDSASGVVVHSDLRRTGWFECSNARVNQLHEAAVWTLRSNMVEIPTDCPHRERSGWGSEWQIFVPSAAFLYDVAGFTTKWLRDLAADQKPDGAVFHSAPENKLGKSEAVIPAGSAGYSDAAVIVPWRIYRAYGDEKLLADQWESMAAWVDWCERVARTQRHPDRIKSRPRPEAHEQFLRDTGVHFGEWLAPPSSIDQYNSKLEDGRDDGDIATAYFHYSAKLLGRIARVLGKFAAAQRYENLAEKTRWAWWTEYGNADGSIRRPTQANYVRALAFGLAPDALREKVASHLVNTIRAADTHVGTGTFGTALLLPVLADAGHAGLAYELLLQDTAPSWLTMLDRGATTIWEMWDGVDENGAAHFSLNHFSFGAVIAFMHTHVAGIRLDNTVPAYRRFRVQPVPGGDLTWAKGSLLSPYGLISSEWCIDSSRRLRLDVTIPPGTSAEILLPDDTYRVVHCGRSQFDCDLG
ncbi:family 78 glycoside hydrolase catalytic domain [Sphingosinicella sp. CPCC 101087]|uniref:family 78 glycoside hydrolase catalytic domain n=1 Tax=Sphingosinicella sp. CPCC 101087 TaxID=2497754 RepID=UPI001FB1341F|nr:family 78 glycoside hydrolase catalytic domain [Sphingosinicella sp. CPCC 101087]